MLNILQWVKAGKKNQKEAVLSLISYLCESLDCNHAGVISLKSFSQINWPRYSFLILGLILLVSIAGALSYKDVNKPTIVK